jgi:hypothetical protein
VTDVLRRAVALVVLGVVERRAVVVGELRAAADRVLAYLAALLVMARAAVELGAVELVGAARESLAWQDLRAAWATVGAHAAGAHEGDPWRRAVERLEGVGLVELAALWGVELGGERRP